jgi:hypothetical protein
MQIIYLFAKFEVNQYLTLLDLMLTYLMSNLTGEMARKFEFSTFSNVILILNFWSRWTILFYIFLDTDCDSLRFGDLRILFEHL